MKSKKLACGLLSLSLAASMTVPAFAAPLKFSDVPKGQWYTSAINSMVEKGLFQGTSTPVNGVGTFSPKQTMSRAEFLQVVIKFLDQKKLASVQKMYPEEPWYYPAYQIATEWSIVDPVYDFTLDDILQPMTREQMAKVLVRAGQVKEEFLPHEIDEGVIADFDSITPWYKYYVKCAYRAGLLTGVDDQGTFLPHGTLSRAEASTVLYRLVVPKARTPIAYEPEYKQPEIDSSIEQIEGNQTWKEGEPHAAPKVGDTVIKADGTKVVLKETTLANGRKILGLYQGVDIATGVRGKNGNTLKPGFSGWNDLSVLVKDERTGECYTSVEWSDIDLNVGTSLPNGKYDGEIRNSFFEWDAEDGMWYWIGADY